MEPPFVGVNCTIDGEDVWTKYIDNAFGAGPAYNPMGPGY